MDRQGEWFDDFNDSSAGSGEGDVYGSFESSSEDFKEKKDRKEKVVNRIKGALGTTDDRMIDVTDFEDEEDAYEDEDFDPTLALLQSKKFFDLSRKDSFRATDTDSGYLSGREEQESLLSFDNAPNSNKGGPSRLGHAAVSGGLSILLGGGGFAASFLVPGALKTLTIYGAIAGPLGLTLIPIVTGLVVYNKRKQKYNERQSELQGESVQRHSFVEKAGKSEFLASDMNSVLVDLKRMVKKIHGVRTNLPALTAKQAYNRKAVEDWVHEYNWEDIFKGFANDLERIRPPQGFDSVLEIPIIIEKTYLPPGDYIEFEDDGQIKMTIAQFLDIQYIHPPVVQKGEDAVINLDKEVDHYGGSYDSSSGKERKDDQTPGHLRTRAVESGSVGKGQILDDDGLFGHSSSSSGTEDGSEDGKVQQFYG